MQRASQQAQTQTTDTPETARGATPASAKAPTWPGYSGNRAALRRLAAAYPSLQCKLTVGAVNDPLEAEADRVADHVMRMPAPDAALSSAPPQISPKCAHCQKEETAQLQRKENASGPPLAPPKVQEALSGSGQPLDPATRAFMEPRFGHNFERVRVHTGPVAEDSARSISALAFTSAHNIVFNSGQYSPATSGGRRLLAHELTHVVQQGAGVSDLQRDEAPIDAAAKATEIEQLVRPGNDEKGALDKLKALDMGVLLKVVEQIYDDAVANVGDEGKRNAHTILGNDILPPDARPTPGPGDSLTDAERTRLRAAFDAAPTRKLRNPKDGDKGTDPTLSAERDKSAAKGRAKPGDWGEDPAGNTWVCHTDGIRSYFGTPITSKSKMRTSTWLGNNPSNFDYTPGLTKRAISSFHWGTGTHHFAIYLNEADASADLRERVAPYATIIAYIRVHLGNAAKDNNRSPEEYVADMKRAVAVNENDSCKSWTDDPAKWANLIKGFKSAEGWKEVEPITAANVANRSTEPKDAALIAYYQKLLGSAP